MRGKYSCHDLIPNPGILLYIRYVCVCLHWNSSRWKEIKKRIQRNNKTEQGYFVTAESIKIIVCFAWARRPCLIPAVTSFTTWCKMAGFESKVAGKFCFNAEFYWRLLTSWSPKPYGVYPLLQWMYVDIDTVFMTKVNHPVYLIYNSHFKFRLMLIEIESRGFGFKIFAVWNFFSRVWQGENRLVGVIITLLRLHQFQETLIRFSKVCFPVAHGKFLILRYVDYI